MLSAPSVVEGLGQRNALENPSHPRPMEQPVECVFHPAQGSTRRGAERPEAMLPLQNVGEANPLDGGRVNFSGSYSSIISNPCRATSCAKVCTSATAPIFKTASPAVNAR